MKRLKISGIEITIILSALSLLFFPRMANNSIGEDEIYFITTSAQFEEWINLETNAESWKINYWTLTAPALPKYIIAIGRLLGGYQRDELLLPYNNSISYEENVTAGSAPSDKLLFVTRTPMVLLAVLTGLLIYVLFLNGINRFAAILWLILYASNNSLDKILLLAMSEAPLLFFSVLSFIFILAGQRCLHDFLQSSLNGTKPTRMYLYFALSGVSLGLAAASKINAFLFLGMFGILLIYSIFVPASTLNVKSKITYLVRLFSICAFSAFFIFVFFNPSFYLNPIKGLGWMFQYRLGAMEWQVQQYPEFMALSIFQRWVKILKDLLTTNASIGGEFGLYVNSAFSLLGIVLLFRSIISSIKRRMPLEWMPSILLYFSIAIVAAFMTPLDWFRYYLFPIIGIMLLIPYSITFLCEQLRTFVKKSARKDSSAT